MILTHELLNPITYKIQNPFSSIIDNIEKWLNEHQKEYLITTWPNIKYEYLKRILSLSAKGSALRGYARLAPTEELKTTLLDVYLLLDRCVYFTNRFRRALFHYLKTNSLSPCWPQFGEKEVNVTFSLLQAEDLCKLKTKMDKGIDFTFDDAAISELLKQVRRPLRSLCYKRVRFLAAADPAAYALEDVQHKMYEAILIAIQKKDYFPKPDKRVGWALKIADNALHNLRIFALAEQRSPILNAEKNESSLCISWNEISNSTLTEITDELPILDGEPFTLADIEEKICVEELLTIANLKIHSYIRTICCGEHNPEFWEWFYYTEPSLAQQISYVEENPETLGPYLQRHLNLPTQELTNFLKQHLPTLLEKISHTSMKRALKRKLG
jgi:hypothetical protein